MIARAAIAGALLLALAGCAPTPRAPVHALSATETGTVWFATAGSLLRRESRYVVGDPVVISGELQLPADAAPAPVVVLAHGCGGSTVIDRTWASVLREWGYATFMLDSFRGRGLSEVCTNAMTLSGFQRIPDAYGALRLLATHPRIDPRRAVLMGFSHGGILTLGASTVWAKETFAPPGQPAFRGFVAFYPYCNIVYPERERLSAPLRIHTGEADDWTPARPCVELAEAIKANGHDVSVTLYPEAHHGFDNPRLPIKVYLPNVDNGARCTFRVPSILGPIPPPSAVRTCLAKGAHIGGNAAALEQARRHLRAQLAELVK
jgi:dienelactone hydrolase